MQNLEDGAADRLAARDSLQTSLSFVIPCLDPILLVDDVESDGKRIDNLLDEVPLLFDLLRPGGEPGLQGRQLGSHRSDDLGRAGRREVATAR